MRQTGKESFVLYTDYQQHISLLSDEEAGRLFKALFEFVESETLPHFAGSLAMCFSFISAQIQRDKEKYIDVCAKRAEAGRLGGKQKQANVANANFAKTEKQKQANVADNDTENDNDNDNDTENETIKTYKVNATVDRVCELLNEGKARAGDKGRVKPSNTAAAYLQSLNNAGVSDTDIIKCAEEIAEAGQAVDWYSFEKIVKKKSGRR